MRARRPGLTAGPARRADGRAVERRGRSGCRRHQDGGRPV